MKIGIIADTHDNLPCVRKAVAFFNDCKLQYIIHAGDYVAPFAMKELLKANARLIGIFGNNDGEKKGLRGLCDNIFDPPHTINLNNKKITIIHDIDMLDSGLKEESDVVIYGHTHKPDINTGKPLFVNPGECGGWLTGISSVALLDIDKMEGEIVKLKND
ncbi:MAG: metallophosphoesterase [Candidatus Anammoxibacter sp.]